jgi:hypothetical protein
MICFTELGSHGRLGNQLFQYAALKSLGLEKEYEVKIPNPFTKYWHGQPCLLSEFNIECSFLDNNDIKKINYNYQEKNHIEYDSNFFNLKDNTNLFGFFQNTKYFSKFEKQIRKELSPKQEYIEKAKQKISKLKEKLNGYEIVSIHLRRGDNTDGTNKGTEFSKIFGDKQELDYNSPYFLYLKEAKQIFKNKKVKFLVFTGGSRSYDNKEDIDWCKKNLVGNEYIHNIASSTVDDFSLMSVCDHNINCPGTSFGWWSAYINQNPTKIVVAPKQYMHPDDHRAKLGFYPNSWIII